MKIRSGFVSNSSSSSFIVAFPKKPTTKNELSEMMFPGDPHGTVPNPWESSTDSGLNKPDVVEQVFSDLPKQKKKVSTKELIDELSSRYFVINGELYYRGSQYYALDKDIAKKFVDMHVENEKQQRDHGEFIRKLTEKHLGPAVPYAFNTGIDRKTKQPHTAEQIKAFADYCEKEKKFRETNEEYIAAEKKNNEFGHKHWDNARKLSGDLAKVDLKAFEDDNTDTYLARFEYSDNDGEFMSLMEHSDIFHNLHHIVISHH